MAKLIVKILNGSLILVLTATVFVQSINIKDLQKKVDYLFEEVYSLGGIVDSIDLRLRQHIWEGSD